MTWSAQRIFSIVVFLASCGSAKQSDDKTKAPAVDTVAEVAEPVEKIEIPALESGLKELDLKKSN